MKPRLMACCVVTWALCWPMTSPAQELVVLIRHADKDGVGTDPEISDQGRRRAHHWGDIFAGLELEIILTSDRTRSRQTGGIMAERLGVPTEEIPVADTAALLDMMTFDYEDARLLIVGHAETIPSILAGLGAPIEVTIADDEYDHLFLLATGASKALHLRVPFPAP